MEIFGTEVDSAQEAHDRYTPHTCFWRHRPFLCSQALLCAGQERGSYDGPVVLDGKPGDAGQGTGRSHLRPAFEGPAAAGLEAIAAVDKGFEPNQFLEGARSAYSMIVQGYASGDKDALKRLLASNVYDRYASAIDERAERKETVKTEIERISSVEIIEATLEKMIARVKVCFQAEIATETLDNYGHPVSGDLGQLANVRENWVFERDTSDVDPNWVLSSVAKA